MKWITGQGKRIWGVLVFVGGLSMLINPPWDSTWSILAIVGTGLLGTAGVLWGLDYLISYKVEKAKEEMATKTEMMLATYIADTEPFFKKLETPTDRLYDAARDAVVAAGKASTSYIQRKLGIRYAQASKLMDMLEQEGVIGPADGAKPREVLSSTTITTSN